MNQIFILFLIFSGSHIISEGLPFINDNISFNALEDVALIEPLSYDVYFSKGSIAMRAGKTQEAIDWFLKAAKDKPNAPQPYFNLGIAYETAGNDDKAIEAYKDAIIQRHEYAKAHNQLAKILHKKGNIDEAINHFELAFQFDPQLVDSAIMLARLLVGQEFYKDSIPFFQKAIAHRPHDIQLKFEYANTLNTINQTEQALDLYFELLNAKPNDTGILYNTAYALKKLGRIEEALYYYRTTLEKNPHHAEAHFSLGLAYLTNGDFLQGWKEYEWRWKRNSQLSQPRNFSQPLWDGSPLNGKILFLHAEQGLGDTFQFIRYAKYIKEKFGGTLIVAVQRSLFTIISQCCPYIDRVITLNQQPVHFDYHAPLLSLPFILKTDINSIPNNLPYINPDATLVKNWKKKLGNTDIFKVGICWQGNSNYSTPFLRAVVAAKSLPLEKLQPLSTIPNVKLYCLQKETGIDQLNHLSSNFPITIFDEDFDQSKGRFMDTAAVMKNLDLVITIDTSICHLAGAIGVPVWVMLPEPPDWRWMLKRSDTPWYPSIMRLYRQQRSGDWNTVIETILRDLEKLVEKKITKTFSPVENHTEATNHNNLLQELLKEQEKIIHKMTQYRAKIADLKTPISDEQFLKALTGLYYLAELNRTAQEKIDLLNEDA